MITSPHNEKLKTIRKLQTKRERARSGLFCAEGEDLVAAAEAQGWPARFVLLAGRDVEPGLLAQVSSLGSGTRAIGVYEQRWAEAGGGLSLYLHGVGDPGNVGTLIRATHAFADGPLTLGPRCADPYSPKAVRASMGSVFARPPARARFEDLGATTIALDPRADAGIAELDASPPLVVCVGGEREGLPDELLSAAAVRARIPQRRDGPESLNAAVAGSVALYAVATRMAADA